MIEFLMVFWIELVLTKQGTIDTLAEDHKCTQLAVFSLMTDAEMTMTTGTATLSRQLDQQKMGFSTD